ncbi:MAG: ketoacyl-ACP synthase III [Ignavibacteriae bacterium]|nr:MAG: ketoacyl-ACP synthase III [Ignavibacteriota bacterium]
MSKIRAAITAVGGFVPERVLSNKDIEKMVETSDAWIKSRTGISERRLLEPGQPTSFMAIRAAQDMLKNHNVSPEDIELIIFSTVTPDMLFPSTACIVQDAIGATNAWGYDLIAACSGFVFALTTGVQFIESGKHKKVLVIGADKMSSITDYSDRNNCILFGDGAACVLLEPSQDENGVMDSILHIDGKGGKYLYMLGGGSLNPPTHETVDKKMHYIFQDGQPVFKAATKGMADVSAEIMEKNGLTADDIKYLVPHQANMRIITATASRMGVGMEKVMVNIHKYGNTTTATIPLCLYEYCKEGKIQKGDNLIISSFGAGYTWGAIWVKWSI